MQIKLHRPDLQRFIEQKVESGEYATPDAVVEEALVRLQEEQGDGDWTSAELREAVEVGLHQLSKGQGIELRNDSELDSFFEDLKRAGREHIDSNHSAQ